MSKPNLSQADLLLADLKAERRQRVALMRLFEQQRVVLALALKRLGGELSIGSEAMERAVGFYDVEVGEAQPLVQVDADPTVAPPPTPPGRLVFRLVDKETQKPMLPTKLNLPQVVRDLVQLLTTGFVDEGLVVAQKIREQLRVDEEKPL